MEILTRQQVLQKVMQLIGEPQAVSAHPDGDKMPVNSWIAAIKQNGNAFKPFEPGDQITFHFTPNAIPFQAGKQIPGRWRYLHYKF